MEHDEGRYPKYLVAARHGAMSAVNDTHTGSCERQFSSCHLTARKIFDIDALNFLKFLSSTFNFRINQGWTEVNWSCSSVIFADIAAQNERRENYGQNLNSSLRWLWILLSYVIWLSAVLYKDWIVTNRLLKSLYMSNISNLTFPLIKIRNKSTVDFTRTFSTVIKIKKSTTEFTRIFSTVITHFKTKQQFNLQ